MKRRVKILVGICSTNSYVNRRSAQRETWLQNQTSEIECIFFLGGSVPSGEENDCVSLNVPDDYQNLPLKVLRFFEYALNYYEFDWLFKCDDDTYVALDRLKNLPDDNYSLIGDMSLDKRGAPSGGAGYMLTRSLVQKIVSEKNIPQIGCEDIIFGNIALKLGAKAMATDRLCMHNSCYPSSDNNIITAHWCSIEQMKMIDLFYRSKPQIICYGEHCDWGDDFLFYKEGVFRANISGKYGSWLFSENGVLILRWSNGDVENLIFIGNLYVGSKLKIIPPAPRFMPNALVELVFKSEICFKIFEAPLYLHIGCGKNYLNGWLNLDMPNFDITKSLPLEDCSVDAIFLEHVIEHILPSEAYNFFQEAMRILKVGGILRLAFPDILRIANKSTDEYVKFIKNNGWGDGNSGSEIRSIIVNHGHKSIWTEETMIITLRSVGFLVNHVALRESSFPHMENLESHGDQIGDAINFLETSCVEAQK